MARTRPVLGFSVAERWARMPPADRQELTGYLRKTRLRRDIRRILADAYHRKPVELLTWQQQRASIVQLLEQLGESTL